MSHILLYVMTLTVVTGWAGGQTVPTIDNGLEPVGQRFTLVFEENLRVSSADDDVGPWQGRFLGLEVDNRGHMYVVDGDANRIIHIDQSGRIMGQIGRTGEGPGEFVALRGFKVLLDGRGLAFESINKRNTFSYFEPSGKFKDRVTLSLPYSVFDWQASPDGRRFCGQLLLEGAKVQMNTYALLDADLAVIQKVQQYEASNNFGNNPSDPEFWISLIANRMRFVAQGDIAFMTFGQDHRFYSALGKKYEITVWDKHGQRERIIRKQYKPIFQSDEELAAIMAPLKEALVSQAPQFRDMFSEKLLNKAVERAGYTVVKNPLFGLIIMEDGHILAVHDYRYTDGGSIIDIFNPKGNFIGKTTTNLGSMDDLIFRNNQAYTLATDEEGDTYLVRFDVTLQAVN